MDNKKYIVKKSNEIIQKSRFNLSVQEQRAIAYICALITTNADGTYRTEYTFNITDYARICGLSCDGMRVYNETKDLLKRLRDKSIWIKQDDGKEVLYCWVNEVEITAHETITIELSKKMIPYLFNLKEKFTTYGLINILKMKSGYSIRLYEILKSYEFLEQKKKAFAIDELKYLLDISDKKTYESYRDLRRRIIEPAIAEINNLTDIKVQFAITQKIGKKVTELTFYYITKSDETKKSKSKPKSNKFNDFSNQQDYNITELESKLLSN